MNSNADKYFIDGCMRCKLGATPKCKVHHWHDVLELLRSIILESGLDEELKWGMPCYTLNGKNVFMLSAFKEYCSINFFKGALMKDPKGILFQPTENTQSTRQIRVTTVQEIVELESEIRAFISQAIEIEKAGLEVKLKKVTDYELPTELTEKFKESPELEKAFKSLTPGRQRAYILHFSGAKQAKTREARIEKYIQQILDGKGMLD